MSLKQCQVKYVRAESVLRRKSFVEGFNSVRKNKPYDYSKLDGDQNEAWNYERGRLLALVYDGPLKEGRYVTSAAIAALTKARSEGLIL